MARQKLEVTLETVTPMFLAGADGQTPELRPASFRGAMRFWLRALLGAYVGADLEALRREESKVFGSTSGASPVVVQTVAWGGSLNQDERRVLPHRSQFTRPSFTEGSRFKLTLAARPGQQLPGEALAALLLMLNLGGVGKRSRRGFGSLRVVEVGAEELNLSGTLNSLSEKQPEDGQVLAHYLTNVIDKACSLVSANGGSPYAVDALPDYPVLSPEHALILVCQHAFNHSQHPYEQAMIDFWRNGLRQPPFKGQDEFGYAKSINVMRNNRRQKKQIRRASPLILHIWRTRTGYHLVLAAFKSHLSPDPDYYRSGNWSLVEDLLKECADRWQGEYIFGTGGW